MIRPFSFEGGVFRILDQRLLPAREEWIECRRASDVADAIRTLAVRGAPAIGIAAAFGIALEAGMGRAYLQEAAQVLIETRPTAVNLGWAVLRCMETAGKTSDTDLVRRLLEEASAIWNEEIGANEAIAEHGLALFTGGPAMYTLLTHCNAGALATGGIGTALGVVKKLHEKGMLERVYMD